MATTNGAPRPSPVQQGVTIMQNLVLAGTTGERYVAEVNRLHGLMADFAMAELRTNSGFTIAAENMTAEQVTSENIDGTPMAEAYWAATSLYFRKVFQAAAAAA